MPPPPTPAQNIACIIPFLIHISLLFFSSTPKGRRARRIRWGGGTWKDLAKTFRGHSSSEHLISGLINLVKRIRTNLSHEFSARANEGCLRPALSDVRGRFSGKQTLMEWAFDVLPSGNAVRPTRHRWSCNSSVDINERRWHFQRLRLPSFQQPGLLNSWKGFPTPYTSYNWIAFPIDWNLSLF